MPELEIPGDGGHFSRSHHQDEQWAYRAAEGVLDRGLRRRLRVPLGTTTWELRRTDHEFAPSPLTWWNFLTASDYATKIKAFTTVRIGGASLLHIAGYFRTPPSFKRFQVFRFTCMQAWKSLPCASCPDLDSTCRHPYLPFDTKLEVRAAITQAAEGW